MSLVLIWPLVIIVIFAGTRFPSYSLFVHFPFLFFPFFASFFPRSYLVVQVSVWYLPRVCSVHLNSND